MEINRTNIFEITSKAGIKPDKDYGQNFLIEPEISKRITNSLKIEEGETIIEVGPGLGSLTHFLSMFNNRITLVDIDKRMTDFLKIVYQNNNVEIIENDIRKVEVSNYDKIVGNLPYNITTEIIQYLLLNASHAKRMVFMIQKETFSHFEDISGKEYGPTSVLIHLLGNIERLFTVKAGCFYPVPKCNSVVFAINIDSKNDRQRCLNTFKIAKLLFINRRKTILNNLINYLKNKELADRICADLDINPLARPEQLPPEMYLKISDYLSSK